MFLPLGTDRPLKRPTLVNYIFVAACLATFMAQLMSQPPTGVASWVDTAMLRPTQFVWWNLLSYQFLHGGFMHLAGNMLFLWVFGPNIEDRLGRLGYTALFLIGGVAAGALHTAFDTNPVIGASGSIAAVTGAYIVFFPRTHIKVLLFFIFIGVFNIPAIWFIGFAIARDVFGLGVGSGGVAYLAHLGGYIFGFSVAMILLATKVLPRETYDLFSIGKQAKRRRDFKSTAASGHTPWAHETPKHIKKSKNDRPDPAAEELARRRAEVSTAVRAGQRDDAIKLWCALADESPAAVMPRAIQLDLAGWLFEQRKLPEADDAYTRFLSQNGAENEAHRVRLMSALIRTRYQHNPAGAAERLEAINPNRLTADERALFDALTQEATA